MDILRNYKTDNKFKILITQYLTVFCTVLWINGPNVRRILSKVDDRYPFFLFLISFIHLFISNIEN